MTVYEYMMYHMITYGTRGIPSAVVPMVDYSPAMFKAYRSAKARRFIKLLTDDVCADITQAGLDYIKENENGTE